MEFTFNIQNSDKLIQAINVAPKETLKEVRLAGKRGVRDVQTEARAKHIFTARTGALERSTETQNNDNQLTWKVGIDEGVAPYGKAVHDGSKPHVIVPKKAKALRFTKAGKFLFAKKINHPGTKPDPFIVDAGKAKQNHVNGLFRKAIQNALKKAFG